jgi:uncharacterized phage protein (predicted DNA packaging)
MALIDVVRKSLRITHTELDDEIQLLIDACLKELLDAGVVKLDETDPLISRAVILYNKANFGFDNAEADRFHDAYVMLKRHLVLAGDYRGDV